METLFLGDSLAVLPTLPAECCDLILTSPPYDDLRTYGGIPEFQFEPIAKELLRVLKKGGVLVWIVGDSVVKGTETATSFKQALFFKEQCGLNLHDTMIWEKNGFSFPSNNRYHQVFEYMFIFSKGKLKTFHPIIDRQNKYAGSKITGTDRLKDGSTRQCSGHKMGKAIAEMGKRYNVWKINTEHSVTWHPAPFPLRLAEDHIQTWTSPGDLVLDPFMGSGTTGVASKILNRQFIGIEINEHYFLEAQKRVSNTAYQGCNLEKLK